jgi:hypothetical protein
MSSTLPKIFGDPIHDLIAFHYRPRARSLLKLINTGEVQRRRRIKHLGVSELVFPGANHGRFAHSLGVLHAAKKLLDQFDLVFYAMAGLASAEVTALGRQYANMLKEGPGGGAVATDRHWRGVVARPRPWNPLG